MDRRDSDWHPLELRRAELERWRRESRMRSREMARWDDDGGAPEIPHHGTETP